MSGWFHGARVGMPLIVLRGDRVVAELEKLWKCASGYAGH